MARGIVIAVVCGVLFFALLFLLVAVVAMTTGDGIGGNTAHIKITGVISAETDDSAFGQTISATDIAEIMKKADENPNIKAILLDINSPGGSAVASEELATAVSKAEKPVVALIRDIGTSGAYWAASSADSIVASPLSITGSVGATASFLEFSGFLEEYGIGYEKIVSGELKDSGTPFRKLTEEEEQLFQEMIEQAGSYFAASVQKNRGLSDSTMEQISSGRIYLGQQAKNLNLIDELGGMAKAEEVIKEKAAIEEVNLVPYEPEKPFNFGMLLAKQSSIIGKSIGAGLFSEKVPVQLK